MGRYKCDKCEFSCNKKHYFKNHQETHYNKKKFNCNLCGFSCYKYNNYKIHLELEKTNFENQKKYIKNFEKKSLDGIKFYNGIPKVVFICWFSNKNEVPQFTNARFSALKNLIEKLKVPVIIITENNYKSFEIKDDPFHISFNNLHGVHKSDYIRCYLLHYYGGGYHDIKFRDESWENCWDEDNWTKNKDIWIYGRREKNEGAIAYPPGFKHLQKQYKNLVTMGCIICRPKTNFTSDLIESQKKLLNKYVETLDKYPGKKPGGCYFQDPFKEVPKNSYPIRWCELLGEIYHPLMTIYSRYIKFGLPDMLKKKRYK